jgi:S1-C subfamily serine protease
MARFPVRLALLSMLTGRVSTMKSRAANAVAGTVLLVLCCLSGGCARYNNTPARRDDSFLPYTDAKVGQVSLRDFLRARSAVVFKGHHLSIGTNAHEFWVKGTVTGIGSAAAIDRRGYFMTAAHCVEKEPFLLVWFDQCQVQARSARIVWRGDESKKEPDLALLQVSSPLQDVFEWTPTVTNGEPIVAAGISVVSNAIINRQCMAGKILKLDTGSTTVLPHYTCVSHDAPLHSGDSGGPLVSIDGRLVGINCDAVIGRPHFISFTVETLSGEAQRPDLDWLRRLIEQDAAAQSRAESDQFKERTEDVRRNGS